MCGRVFEECGLKSSLDCAEAHGGVLVASEIDFFLNLKRINSNTGD